MKVSYLIISGILLTAWLVLGSIASPFGSPLPALGPFFNPATGYWRNATVASLSRKGSKEISINHPNARGTIYFDELGVPHIFADQLIDASFLQGYVHASDRLWQMDVSTRATEGNLSSIMGERTVERDIEQIQLGYAAAARGEVEILRQDFPEEYELLQAYSAGVNAFIDQSRPGALPIEYKLIGHKPLRWSPYRSALFLKGMSQSLSSRYQDVERGATREQLGDELFALLFPDHLPDERPVVPVTEEVPVGPDGQLPVMHTREPSTSFSVPDHAPASAPASTTAPPLPHPIDEEFADLAYTLMPEHPGNGSNNWAVNEARSNTGYPILASDPHLGLTLPSIWYEIQIHLPEVNARGVSLPGAPGILIGFNDDIAYGETNVGQDVTDWFRIEWTDPTRTAYELDGEVVQADYRIDTLIVRGAKNRILRTPLTVFGPVPFSEGPYANLAMRYLGHELIGKELRTHSTISAFLQLMAAKNHDDYEKALSGYVDPAQNFLYADRHNTIAIRPNGFFPVRPEGDGGTVYPGDSTKHNWRGYIPFENRPNHFNPERDYVASANQITTGPDYPYAYTGGFDSYRGRFINRHIEREGVMTQRSMKELQLSSYSLMAEEITPLLLARLDRSRLTDEGRRLLRLIADWDYRYEGDSRAATLFEMWRHKVYDLTFDELEDDQNRFMSPDLRVWIDLIRRSPNHEIFDIQATENFEETASTLVQRAFDEVTEDLDSTLPKPWAEQRNSSVRHLGAIPGLGSAVIQSGGGPFTPRVLVGNHGASWRMVVELGKHPRAWGALPGGASGHPGSFSYANGLDDWSNGRYHELVRWEDHAEAANKSIGQWDFTPH